MESKIKDLFEFIHNYSIEIIIFLLALSIPLLILTDTCVNDTSDYQMERIKQEIEYNNSQIEYIKFKTKKLKQELKEFDNTTIVDDTAMEHTNIWTN